MSDQRKNHVIVVGGGAAGLVAAISARRLGARVTLLERNPRVGKKLLVTGNGRCNYTNTGASVDCYCEQDPDFPAGALGQFDVEQTIRFFEKLGVAHRVEECGKVFPMSDQASSVLDLLRYEVADSGVEVVCEAFVQKIGPGPEKLRLELKNGRVVEGDRVILATGGRAMPASGSDGNGYDLARALGHQIVECFPALVQLKLKGTFFNQVEGVKVLGRAAVLCRGEVLASDRGDLIFTNYGISGPPILQISRRAGELLRDHRQAVLRLTLIDSMSNEELRDYLTRRFRNMPGKIVDFSLVGLINKRLIPVIWKEAGISTLQRPVQDLETQEIAQLANILTDWQLEIVGNTSWPNAQVTAGGVDTGEIDSYTMESKLVRGIYFAGEMIDVDGPCGGYNLQWAWSSGYVAGRYAALGTEITGGELPERR
jgi:predicted Rossmann fold flavoprotein